MLMCKTCICTLVYTHTMITLPKRTTLSILAALVGAVTLTTASAQTTPALYDPQPPADSGYVRVLLGGTQGAVEIHVDGKSRLANLALGEPSDYMVLSAGKHQLTIKGKGKLPSIDVPLDVVAGRALTVALTTLQPNSKPLLFEDKSNANRLKAILAVYHLDGTGGQFDVLSADGNTKVFSKIAASTSASLAVNPLTIDLITTKVDDKTALATASLAMAQGASYSIVLLSAEGGRVSMKSYANKVERYTGK